MSTVGDSSLFGCPFLGQDGRTGPGVRGPDYKGPLKVRTLRVRSLTSSSPRTVMYFGHWVVVYGRP